MSEFAFRTARTSSFPGLSPHGRVVLAGIESTRLWPGVTTEALELWTEFVRDPYHRLWDPQYEGCRQWGCCTPMDDVRSVLELIAHRLPGRDAGRFRAMLTRIDEDW